MPRLTRISLRLSLAFLGAGVTLGSLMLANEGLGFSPWLWELLPAHIVILLFGWMAQFAFAIAYWILPRRGGQRGSTLLAVVAIGSLNLGVILEVVSVWPSFPTYTSLLGYLFLALGSIVFAVHSWDRLGEMKGRHL